MEKGGDNGMSAEAGKGNVEQQENVMSEHAVKVREARHARRTRILARSSERLAYITSAAAGEAKSNSSPPPFHHSSPLLDKSNSFSATAFYQEGIAATASAVVSHTHTSDQESSINKSYLADEYKQGTLCEHQQQHVITSCASSELNRENTSKEGANIAQPSKNTNTAGATITQPSKNASKAGRAIAEPSKKTASMGGHKQKAHESTNENQQAQDSINGSPPTAINKVSYCIQYSQLPRLICAACTALVVSVASFSQGGRLDRPGTLDSTSALSLIHAPLAIVLLLDLLCMGAFFFFSSTEQVNWMKKKAEVSTLNFLTQLLLTISLDCSIFAAFLGGGYLILSK